MTDPAEDLTLEALDTWSRAHGYGFSRERLAAVLPEVRRLREAIKRLQALPLDEESPVSGV